MTIYDIPLSKRTFNCLKNAGLIDFKDLVKLSLEDFYKIKNMGKKSVKEIFYIMVPYINGEKEIIDLHTTCLIGGIDKKIYNYTFYLPTNEHYFSTRVTNFLEKNKLETIGQILDFDFNKKNTLGKKSIEELQAVIEGIVSSISVQKYEPLQYINFSQEIKFNKIDGAEKTRYSDSTNKSIFEIEKDFILNEEEIIQFKDEKDFYTYSLFKKLKEIDSIDINSCLRESFLTRDDLNILLWRARGATLESIGQTLNLTRERVRQREAKTLKKLRSRFQRLNLEILFNFANILTKDNNTVFDDELYIVLLSNIEFLTTDYVALNFDDTFIVVQKEYLNNQEAIFNDFVCKTGPLSLVSDIKKDIDEQLFNYFLAKNKYVENGLYLFKRGTKRDYLKIYIELRTVVDFSTAKLTDTMKDFYEIFGVDLVSQRACLALGEDVGTSIGDSKYISSGNWPEIDKHTLKEIKKYINSVKYAKSEDIYLKFRDKITNVYSPTHLYKYLKRILLDEYNFGGANLAISTRDTVASNNQRIHNYLKQQNGPVNRHDLVIKFNINQISMIVIDQQNDDIIKYGKDNYYLKSKLIIDDSSRSNILSFISGKKVFRIVDLYTYLLSKSDKLLNYNFIHNFNEFVSYITNINLEILASYSLANDIYTKCENKDYEENKDFII